MAKPIISAERLRELLHYDPETGAFRNRTRRGHSMPGCIPGTICRRGYIWIVVEGHRNSGHRFAWLWMTGRWPVEEVDHKDGNPSNNRWSNLREATQKENMQNVRKTKPAISGYRGVTKDPRYAKPWIARISDGNKTRHIGRFATAEEAHEAYVKARREIHPFSEIDLADSVTNPRSDASLTQQETTRCVEAA